MKKQIKCIKKRVIPNGFNNILRLINDGCKSEGVKSIYQCANGTTYNTYLLNIFLDRLNSQPLPKNTEE